jgi:uncharacterized membrane protein
MHFTHFYPRSLYFFDGGHGLWTNPYFWIPNLIGLALLVVAVIFVVGAFKKRKTFMVENYSEAINLLKLKYVNGEIDEETYRKKLAVLK